MEDKNIESIEKLQVDVNDANKEFSDGLDRIIVTCEEISVILNSIEGKLDKMLVE